MFQRHHAKVGSRQGFPHLQIVYRTMSHINQYNMGVHWSLLSRLRVGASDSTVSMSFKATKASEGGGMKDTLKSLITRELTLNLAPPSSCA